MSTAATDNETQSATTNYSEKPHQTFDGCYVNQEDLMELLRSIHGQNEEGKGNFKLTHQLRCLEHTYGLQPLKNQIKNLKSEDALKLVKDQIRKIGSLMDRLEFTEDQIRYRDTRLAPASVD
ncbi:hypothetical protein NHQ30_009637 [Ciborinia camelliae]|nr:hypothetical protein NHQ30_009637 [Ciborinia camelliae]